MITADNMMFEVSCPLCRSNRWRFFVSAPSHYGPEKHQVTKCQDCGMIFTNPQSATYLHDVQHRGVLERHLDPDRFPKGEINARFQLRLLARYSGGRKLLDFGCGAGLLVKVAIEEGWHAIGLDLNGELVAAANQYWGFQALRSSTLAEFSNDGQGPFDAIISNQVFEHIQNPTIVGNQLVGLLKPGGVFYIDVPYVHQLKEWFSRGSTLDPTSHWCHYSKKTIKKLMVDLGCKILFCSAAPSLVSVYNMMGLMNWIYPLGCMTKSILPAIGTGVCVIGRKQ